MKIRCTTLFDITHTGITSRRGAHNQLDDTQYNILRNKQSNWETILQVIGLRTQPENIVSVEHKISRWGKKTLPTWTFTFTVNASSIFSDGADPLALLLQDCDGVPMIMGLDESSGLEPRLCVSGSKANIIFSIENE